MPEVCGPAAVMVDPFSVESIADGLARLLNDRDLQEHLRELGKRRAEYFTWKECAQKTLSVYQAAIQGTEGNLSKLF